MARIRTAAVAALVSVALLGACGDDDSDPQRDDAPVNEQTPSGQQQGETTPAPQDTPRGDDEGG
jgi:hypothetical protein